MSTIDPKAGDVLSIEGTAGGEPGDGEPMLLRIIGVDPRCGGNVWLSGYRLDERGEAIDKRELFVERTRPRPASPPRRTHWRGGL